MDKNKKLTLLEKNKKLWEETSTILEGTFEKKEFTDIDFEFMEED